MSIAEAIRNNQAALAAATAGDWAGCAAALRTITVTTEPRSCGNVETADAIDAVGNRRRAIMQAMQSDPDGSQVLAMLNTTGVKWAHERTQKLLDVLISAGVATTADKTALVELSAPTTYPFAEITPEQCASEWLQGADVRMMCNITDGVTALHFQVIRDGNPVRVVSLKEGTGSEIEQALLTAIETAIDAYLVGA